MMNEIVTEEQEILDEVRNRSRSEFVAVICGFFMIILLSIAFIIFLVTMVATSPLFK